MDMTYYDYHSKNRTINNLNKKEKLDLLRKEHNYITQNNTHDEDNIEKYIEEYIKDKPVSPITNKPLIFPYLIPNWNLRKLITSYVLYKEHTETVHVHCANNSESDSINFDNEDLYINNYDEKIINIIDLLNQ